MANGIVVYIGAGAYLAGVPARDMTLDEWEALDPADRATALALDLYQVATVAKTPAAPVKPPVAADKEE